MGKRRQGQWSSLVKEPGAERSSVGVLKQASRRGMTKAHGTPTHRNPKPARWGAAREEETAARWERHANDLMRNHWQAEVRLWATVLVDAVKCVRVEGPTRDQTRAWIAGTDEITLLLVSLGRPDALFTFRGVCQELDLDEDFVRADLLARPVERTLRVVA